MCLDSAKIVRFILSEKDSFCVDYYSDYRYYSYYSYYSDYSYYPSYKNTRSPSISKRQMSRIARTCPLGMSSRRVTPPEVWRPLRRAAG